MKAEYDITPFNIINTSDILCTEDLQELLPLATELEYTFKNTQMFRTRTEMEISVLNSIKFPTHASKYWQAMREQNVMFHELVMLSYEYRKNIIEIKKLQRNIEKEKDDLEKDLLQIEIDKKIFISKNQERVAKERIREIKEWSNIKESEKLLISASELENVDNHQLISYRKRFINESILIGNEGSPSERNNLLGQLRSAILKCIHKGILEDAIKDYSLEIQNKIKTDYNYKLIKDK
jgi:hypothetical protein